MSGAVRVYLAASPAVLRALADGSPWSPGAGFCVTARSRSQAPDADEEELEFAAFLDAASACLDAPDGPPRRVVVSADVPASAVVEQPEGPATAVTVAGTVGGREVAAVHADDAAAATVVAAVRDGADPSLLDDVALAWFHPSEIESLLADLDDHPAR